MTTPPNASNGAMNRAPDPRHAAAIARLPAAAAAVLEFWFGTPADPQWAQDRAEWFRKDDAFDARIRSEFGAVIEQALRGTLDGWTGAWGELAHIVVLDQFCRNALRGEPRAFAGDDRALTLAQRLVERGADLDLPPVPRTFAYLPFEHAENLGAQDQAARLFGALAAEHPACASYFDYAERHRAVIARFGRFPHRNAILGRASTPQELAFLQLPGSGF